MSIEELLQKLEQKEIYLSVQNKKLVKKAARPIPSGISNTIRAHEQQLLRYLTQKRRVADQPPLDPRADPPTPAAVCFSLLENPPTRTEAIERLVATFRAEIHEAQRQRWLTTTLSGKPLGDAPKIYLLAETVGLLAWAQEREKRSVYNQGAYTWIAAAWQAAERRAHRLKAA